MRPLKLSQFTLFVEDSSPSNSYLIYNTLTRAFMRISAEGQAALQALNPEEPSDLDPTVAEQLLSAGFVVPAHQDEIASYRQRLLDARAHSEHFHATLLTTYRCPMQCVYCYQQPIRQEDSLSLATTRQIVQWLQTQLADQGTKRCHLTFYGGEPLSHVEPLEFVAREMHAYCESHAIQHAFAMVTSGLLFTETLARHLRQLGVSHLQITLDGDQEAHDRRRPLRTGGGTFERILGNLDYLVHYFRIRVLCNVDKGNLEATHRLMEILESKGLAGKVQLVFGPVSEPLETTPSQDIICPDIPDGELLELNLQAAKRGFAQDLRPALRLCGMLQPTYYVIDPRGKLYTCPLFLGTPAYTAGDVGNLERDEWQRPLHDLTLPEDCFHCPYIPICGGGCRHRALTTQGDIRAIDCQREILASILPAMLRAHYTSRTEHV